MKTSCLVPYMLCIWYSSEIVYCLPELKWKPEKVSCRVLGHLELR